MKLRKGKTKSILEGSIDSALLAVEVYNKPRTTFRTEAYITLMVMAWTKLLHAYFNHKIGDRYYYREDNGRYKKEDGERKAWELGKCIKEYNKLNPCNLLSEPVVANLHFAIGLRNKVEHRHVAKGEVDVLVFGECQSLLYNYENALYCIFGSEYGVAENLVFSLQFSHTRSQGQQQSSKKMLSKEVEEIRNYIETYRLSLSDATFNSQEYSVKLIQIPKISNTNRSDLAIEFVLWDELNEKEKEKYEELVTLIKEKRVKKEVVNAGKLKTGEIVDRVKELWSDEFNQHDHKCFYFVFSVRPIKEENLDPFETNTNYCHYDEPHNDYIYKESWIDFIVDTLATEKMTRTQIRGLFKERKKLLIESL